MFSNYIDKLSSLAIVICDVIASFVCKFCNNNRTRSIVILPFRRHRHDHVDAPRECHVLKRMPQLGKEDLVPKRLWISEPREVRIEEREAEHDRVHGHQHDEEGVERGLVVKVLQHDDGQNVA